MYLKYIGENNSLWPEDLTASYDDSRSFAEWLVCVNTGSGTNNSLVLLQNLYYKIISMWFCNITVSPLKHTIWHFRWNVQIAVHLMWDIHVPYQSHLSKPYFCWTLYKPWSVLHDGNMCKGPWKDSSHLRKQGMLHIPWTLCLVLGPRMSPMKCGGSQSGTTAMRSITWLINYYSAYI